ncbi:MAG: hypothetical protein HY775_07070, partial [Acidobacteria bacterium]|nr:hypothetical protein [Acidobacteriota bacterium]
TGSARGRIWKRLAEGIERRGVVLHAERTRPPGGKTAAERMGRATPTHDPIAPTSLSYVNLG